jgi:hypothetical protein
VDTGLCGGIADNADGLSRPFASARIRLGTLSANGQAAEVANATVAFDTLKALQVHTDLAAKVAFDDIFAILNRVDDLGKLLFAQIFRADSRVDVGLGQDVFGVAGADAVNVTERDVDALIRGNFYANDTCHVRTGLVDYKMFYCNLVQLGATRLALTLLVPRVGANDANDAFALNDFAVFAKFLN